ncbi:hypothetical protein GC170_17075 [bacterium]|nr:hypothetical protein [bacterium]
MAREFRHLFTRSKTESVKTKPRIGRNRRLRRGEKRSLPIIESLEGRVVLTYPLVSYVLSGTASTTVTGTVYDDVDKSGTRTNGENGVSGWTVYLDLDNSGTLNRDAAGDLEPSAITNKDGDFVISHLQPGTYRLAEVMQTGWEATSPTFQDLTVVKDRDTKADFFDFSGGDIIGTVWNDLDQDGNRATDPSTGEFTEPGLANWTVFLDSNNDRVLNPGEPWTLTDANGNYGFYNLPEGDYEVTEVVPGTWDISPGYDNRQTAAVTARSQFVQDFANFSTTDGSIDGTVWNDLNFDGIRQTDPGTGEFTEPGLEGWTVFIDTNGNGALDDGELSTLTDANGNYAFISLAEGDYEVTEILPEGWESSPEFDIRQTVGVFAGERTTAGDFANVTVLNGAVSGTVWNDLNRDGIRNTNLSGAFTEPGIANWQVYLDLNRNGVEDSGEPTALTDAGGHYVFADLQVGDYEVREILAAGWEPSLGHGDSYGVTVYSGVESIAPDFAVFNLATVAPGSINGTVWNDLDGDGVRDQDSGTGAFTDPGLPNRTVFVDLNANGVFDPTEPSAVTAADGSYSITGVLPGSVRAILAGNTGWRSTAPLTGSRSITLRNAENLDGIDFGTEAIKDSSIRGVVFADTNGNGTRDAGEKGIAGVVVYLDMNGNGTYDPTEPSAVTSADQFFTPDLDESGTYAFTHLAAGDYAVRTVIPEVLSATPAEQRVQNVTIAGGAGQANVDTAARYRLNEIHGVKFDDVNGDGQQDAGEPGIGGAVIYVDSNRNGVHDADEPETTTEADGSYTFSGLTPGAYVVRQILEPGHSGTYPNTTGGILWPQGVSNPAVGIVTPDSITTALATGETYRQSVSITMPNTGALTNLVDVFLLFDDTGSFVNNSPIVRSAFPTIISQLQASLPGIDLGFGVGRFEEYANFASEYSTGRPFVLNQPIVAASTTGYMDAIQSALNRTTPGYGGDQPETDIEALYQLVTGLGFDGNDNGSVLDSGAAGLVSTQLNPGNSGDVPSFASFRPDPSGNVLAAAGSIGGGGFRAGALPIILVATDTGFAFQPKGESIITGVGGSSRQIASFTQTSRSTTPFGAGAGIQQTITALNSLGSLVIGLGTNPQANVDPRQGLEAISYLTGAVNRTTTTIANGTADPIAPGDPLYFQIASGFAGSVANGVVSAIQNAVTNVAVDITIQASDPRVRIIDHTGSQTGIGSGQTANFDVEFVGDGVPHRFDLQFVRTGTNVVLGSIPVVIGTPIPGDGYEFEDLEEGEIAYESNFGSQYSTSATAPVISVTGGSYTFDGATHAATATATGPGGVTVPGTFTFTYDGSATLPVNAGIYAVQAFFTSADPNYSDTVGTGSLTIASAAPTIHVTGGSFAYDGSYHTAAAQATGLGGVTIPGTFTFTYDGSATLPVDAGTYAVQAFFTSADPNYSNAAGTTTLTIAPTTPAISVTGGSFVYDGNSHTATATATGLGGLAIPGNFTFTYDGSATLPVNAGNYAVLVDFESSDPNYLNATGTATLTISGAQPTLTVTVGSFVYYGNSHSATATATGLGGLTIPGNFTFTYDGSTILPVNAGNYAVLVDFESSDPNYLNATGTSTLTIDRAIPVFDHLFAESVIEGTTVSNVNGHLGANSVFPAGGIVQVDFEGVTYDAIVDATGSFQIVLPTSGLTAGSYGINLGYAGDGANFEAAANASMILQVTQASQGFAVSAVDIQGIAGAPIEQAVATITDPGSPASAFLASIDWGDGAVSEGKVIIVDGMLTVIGEHTYSEPGTFAISISILDSRVPDRSANATSIATITSLGVKAIKTREAEFWAEKNGQSLIRIFDGIANSTRLANWLAGNFPNLYGANAGSNDLTAKSNAQVALFFQRLWQQNEESAEIQVLTTALNVYATTTSLGGFQGSRFGFEATSTGLGATWFEVGKNGAAVSVPNYSKPSVFRMLKGVDSLARNGKLYDGNRSLWLSARSLFKKLNSI